MICLAFVGLWSAGVTYGSKARVVGGATNRLCCILLLLLLLLSAPWTAGHGGEEPQKGAAERPNRATGERSGGEAARREWFIAAPAFMETGGPEALHQLCLKLREAGEEASMLYLGPMDKLHALNRALERYNGNTSALAGELHQTFLEAVTWGAEAPARYRYCGCPTASRAPFLPTHVVILPEVWTQYLDVIGGREARKVVWWLSVDNNGGSFKAFSETASRGVLHLANSHYGLDYLKRRGIAAAQLLPDYVDFECGGHSQRGPEAEGAPEGGQEPRSWSGRRPSRDRDKIIVYNPSKGADETRRILAALSARTDARRAAGNQSSGRALVVPVQQLASSARLLSRARVSHYHSLHAACPCLVLYACVAFPHYPGVCLLSPARH